MVKHAVQTMLFDFIRIHWRSLSNDETSHIKTSSLNQLKCANINDKKCTRICAEIGKFIEVEMILFRFLAIREWPQQWSELSESLSTTTSEWMHWIKMIRIFCDIQFDINNQNIPNLARQKELSKSLCEVHPVLIKLILSIVMDNSIPIGSGQTI